MDNNYGFKTIHNWTWDYDGLQGNEKPTKKKWVGWRVYLPHSCDEWVITYAQEPEKAISEVEDFIAQAQQVLAKLKEEVANFDGSLPT